MKKSTRILLGIGCIAVLLTVFLIETASAAIVPFNGVDYSWLHHDDNGDPVADWIDRISDVAPVRNGDAMQFQNRWYNSYAGTADIRISYGGDFAGICTGGDEYVLYGLNYGNYYPSGTGSWPAYSTVINCSKEPLYLMVTHQYVFNGIQYGTLDPSDKSRMFQWRADINDSRVIQTGPTQTPEKEPTQTPITGSPTRVPLPGGSSESSPGFGFGAMIILVATLAAAYVLYGIVRKI
jgi:hypothetical protein